MEDKIGICWRKSSYSGNGGGNCVEVAGRGSRVLVRDTAGRGRPGAAVLPGRVVQVRRTGKALVSVCPGTWVRRCL